MSPLAGETVLDLGNLTAGPLTSWLLGSLGADVIKIESPSGDHGRSLFSDLEQEDDTGGYYFHSRNAGKRSVVLDLKTEDGRNTLIELIPDTDILVENFRPGTMAALDLSYDTLHAHNDALIYCSITGYGQDNAGMEKRAYDSILQALSGVLYATGYSEDPPTTVGASIVDNLGSYVASVAILAALRYRDHTGTGQSIDISLHDCSAWLVQTLLPFEPTRTRHQPSPGPYLLNGVFEAADGLIAIATSDRASIWRLRDHVLGVTENPNDLEGVEEELAAWLETTPVDRAKAEFEAVGVSAAPISTLGDVVMDPHLQARDSFAGIDYHGDSVPIPVSPYRTALGGTEPPRRGGPALGEHTDEVLRQFNDYDDDQITALRNNGAIQ